MKFDFDDLLLCPCENTAPDHRPKEFSYLPLATAPMDTVVDATNVEMFSKLGFLTVLPRGVASPFDLGISSLGLEEAKSFECKGSCINIDVANGHMAQLLPLVAELSSRTPVMCGNIGNPQAFLKLAKNGASWVRVGIGAGNGCLTTQQTGVGYPMASLILETRAIKLREGLSCKIVADGGFKGYADVIKAVAVGADYVMLGSILNRALESCGPTFRANVHHETWTEPGDQVNQYDPQIRSAFLGGAKFYKKFRGMSTKEAQLSLGRVDLRTSEGVLRMQPVEYTLDGWLQNFKDYLGSAMSYLGIKELRDFVGCVTEPMLVTEAARRRYAK